MMIKRERRGRGRIAGLSYTMAIVVTESLSYDAKDEVVIEKGDGKKTFSLRDTCTQIGSRSFSSDTMSLPSRNTRILPARILP